MTTIAQTKVEDKRTLKPATATGWRRGLANLLRKEMSEWWGTKMWLVQLIIWMLLLNGITTIMMVAETIEGAKTTAAIMEESATTFLQMGMFAVALGLVITAQGAIVGERQLGTAAWVMSKPSSRPAFIISKAAAYLIGFGVTAILIPSTIFLLEARVLFSFPLSLPYFLVGLAVVFLNLLFYLTLTLMLGTLFSSRGPVVGIGLALLLAGILLKNLIPVEFQIITPWLLPDVGTGLALQQQMPDIWYIPVVASAIWILVFSFVALWRISREEF